MPRVLQLKISTTPQCSAGDLLVCLCLLLHKMQNYFFFLCGCHFLTLRNSNQTQSSPTPRCIERQVIRGSIVILKFVSGEKFRYQPSKAIK